jgi:hypothetical protein
MFDLQFPTRLAGPPAVVQNSVVVDKYLRLFGNKIEICGFGRSISGERSPQNAATNFRSGSGPKSIVNTLKSA